MCHAIVGFCAVPLTLNYNSIRKVAEGVRAQTHNVREHKVYLIHETNPYKTKGKLNWGAKHHIQNTQY